MLEYIKFLEQKHRATLQALLDEGRPYRSRFVAREQGYLAALEDIEDALLQPQRNTELKATMAKFAERLRAK